LTKKIGELWSTNKKVIGADVDLLNSTMHISSFSLRSFKVIDFDINRKEHIILPISD